MRKRIDIAPPTLVDRLVGYFAPGAGLKRMRDRTMLAALSGQGGYHGGKRDRRATKNWRPGGNSADADLLPELEDIRARSRDLARNAPVATGAIATKKTHVVGDGLRVTAQCDRWTLGLTEDAAEEWNRLAEREFALACSSADYTRVQVFDELQVMVFGSRLESGDVFVIRRWRMDAGDTYGTKLQVIEADRVCNPGRGQDTDTLVAGVEFLGSGVPIAVHVADRHPGDYRAKAVSWRRVPMRYNDGSPIVLHLTDRQRPDQTRGIPLLAPVIEAVKSITDYEEAEVAAALTSAMFTVFVTAAGDADSGPLPTSGEGASGKDEVTLGKGAIIDLAQGEDVKFADPNRPNAEFDNFMTAVLRQIGVALEIPFELLIKHFTASYSASRAALEMAYHTFRRDRTWLARRFCQPFYEWVIEEAIMLGRLQAPGFFDDPLTRSAWLRTMWTGPVRMSLDPKKDAEADKIDVEMHFKTRQQVMTERTGGDYEQKIAQAAREQRAMDEAGLAPAPASTPSQPGQDDNPDDTSDDDPEV